MIFNSLSPFGHTDRTLERAKQATNVQSVKIGFNPSRWAWKLPDTKDANALGALRETKDAKPLGALRANPHEQTEIELPGTVENVEGSHSSVMASFGDEGDQVEAERLAEKHADILNRNGLHRMLDRREIAHIARAGFALCGIPADDLHDDDGGTAPRCSNCLRTSDGARADWGDA